MLNYFTVWTKKAAPSLLCLMSNGVEGENMKAVAFGDYGNQQIYLNLLLCTLCSLDQSWTAVWLSAALLWHLDVIQQKKKKNEMGDLSCWCVSLCDKTSHALLQWSEAPSPHSHRRHPYHLPGQAGGCREIHLQSEQQPRYLALGVGLPDCSVWVLPWQQSGGGGAGRRYSELCEESSSSSMEAACVGRLLYYLAALLCRCNAK